MPTLSNVTVVAQPYDVGGNGGRKLVQLENGWLVAGAFKNTTDGVYLYKSENNGTTWTQFHNVIAGDIGFSLTSKGNIVYVLFKHNFNTTQLSYQAYDVEKSTYITGSLIESGQTAISPNTSLTINEQGTELHATWASKGSPYTGAFNIRYAKGIINENGSITWGSARWITIETARDSINPSIILNEQGFPIIFAGKADAVGHIIQAHVYNGETWSNHVVYNGISHVQQNPSAMFVPQRINGLPDGRIWVAWQSRDSNSSNFGLRVAFSDDGGVTWTVQQVRTSTASVNEIKPPSIAYDENNNIFVTYAMGASALLYDTLNSSEQWRQYEHSSSLSPSGAVSSLSMPKASVTRAPVIYTNANRVGFYGSWQETKINVPEGFIGVKDDPNDIFKYAITTDSSMGLITEKVNGVVTRTRSTTNGTTLTFSLTPEQWGNVTHGKYANANGEPNVLSVSMSGKEWFYTFDKRLHPQDSLLNVVRAVGDIDGTFIPAVKNMLIDKVGGDATDTFESIIKNGDYGVNIARGNFTSDGTYNASVRGLLFKPQIIITWRTLYSSGVYRVYRTVYISNEYLLLAGSYTDAHGVLNETATQGVVDASGNTSGSNITDGAMRWVVTTTLSDGFDIKTRSQNTSFEYIALG